MAKAAWITDLERSPAFRRARREAAAAIVGAAQNAAPRETGRYARSLRVVEQGDVIAAATVDFAGHLVEFGSANNFPYAPLRRGTRTTGLRFDPSSI